MFYLKQFQGYSIMFFMAAHQMFLSGFSLLESLRVTASFGIGIGAVMSCFYLWKKLNG